MNAKLKSKWVKALRSDKYEQCQNELESEDGRYCCLGVLCVVAKKPFDAETYNWLKRTTGDYSPLVTLNDIENKPFPEIADYIEKNL